MTEKPFDPWNSGTPAYRAALMAGMTCTFLGILTLILSAVADSDLARTSGLVLIGAGILSHVIGIGLRKRQAVQIIRERKSQG